MTDEKFSKFLKETYEAQTNWYDKKATQNKKMYHGLQFSLILFSALTPIFIAMDWTFTDTVIMRWVSIISSVLVVLLASTIKMFKFQENWIIYRSICEQLKREKNLFDFNRGIYSGIEDKQGKFVDRVQDLISKENSRWINLNEDSPRIMNP